MPIGTGTALALGGGLLGGSLLAGGRTQKSSVALTPEQRQLTLQQIELGEFQLAELERQRRAQQGIFTGAEQQAGQFESLISGFSGAATPEQRSLIDETFERTLAAGESDILRFQGQATEQLREELAPQLGLRPGDTPIQDRGARIAEESVRQQGQLSNLLAGQRAGTLLQFPQAIQEFQSQLQQNAFLNRLQLGGAQATAGLGLAGVATPNIGPAFAGLNTKTNVNDPLATFSGIAGGLGGLLTGLGSI